MTDQGFAPLFDVLDRLHGLDARLGGGWGIDVLVGRVSRAHHDVDVFVPVEVFADAVSRFTAAGFGVVLSEPDCRTVVEAADGRRVDLNAVVYDAARGGVQADRAGDTELFAVDGWVDRAVAGRTLRCLSAEAQREKHTGYPSRPVDAIDLAVLSAADADQETGESS